MLHVAVTKLSLLHFRLDLHILAPVPFSSHRKPVRQLIGPVFGSLASMPSSRLRTIRQCHTRNFSGSVRKVATSSYAEAVSISVKTQSCRSLDGTIGATPTCRLIRAASLPARFGKSGLGIQDDCCGLLRPHAPAPSVWARDTSKHGSELSFNCTETQPETREPCLPLAGPWRAHTCPPSPGALAPTNGPDMPKPVALQCMCHSTSNILKP